jgi:hypothetical protein
MDKLEYYRYLIQKVLTEYYELGANSTQLKARRCAGF